MYPMREFRTGSPICFMTIRNLFLIEKLCGRARWIQLGWKIRHAKVSATTYILYNYNAFHGVLPPIVWRLIHRWRFLNSESVYTYT